MYIHTSLIASNSSIKKKKILNSCDLTWITPRSRKISSTRPLNINQTLEAENEYSSSALFNDYDTVKLAEIESTRRNDLRFTRRNRVIPAFLSVQTIKLDLATLVARTWRATRRVSFRKVDKHAGSGGLQ